LPFHLASLFFNRLFSSYERMPDSALLRVGCINGIGLVLSLCGFFYLFQHFGPIYGKIFIIAGVTATFLGLPVMHKFKKENYKES